MPGKKKLMIVDDSEIDRSILKNILAANFDVVEADNGYAALELITNHAFDLDGLLLDISMPILDGFAVLDIMKENGVKVPTILISAEATTANVQRAMEYHISGFISKPYDAQTVLAKVAKTFDAQLAEESSAKGEEEGNARSDAEEIEMYIARLTAIYREYLKLGKRDESKYRRVSKLVKILLSAYEPPNRLPLDSGTIKLISNAAYFYDIGMMGLPDDMFGKKTLVGKEKEIFESHTRIGANIISLNSSRACKNFVQVCAEICMNHHERYDGNGFPYGIKSGKISPYGQIVHLAIWFDTVFIRREDFNRLQFEFVLNELNIDRGAVAPEYVELLGKCRGSILYFYKNLEPNEQVAT